MDEDVNVSFLTLLFYVVLPTPEIKLAYDAFICVLSPFIVLFIIY